MSFLTRWCPPLPLTPVKEAESLQSIHLECSFLGLSLSTHLNNCRLGSFQTFRSCLGSNVLVIRTIFSPGWERKQCCVGWDKTSESSVEALSSSEPLLGSQSARRSDWRMPGIIYPIDTFVCFINAFDEFFLLSRNIHLLPCLDMHWDWQLLYYHKVGRESDLCQNKTFCLECLVHLENLKLSTFSRLKNQSYNRYMYMDICMHIYFIYI